MSEKGYPVIFDHDNQLTTHDSPQNWNTASSGSTLIRDTDLPTTNFAQFAKSLSTPSALSQCQRRQKEACFHDCKGTHPGKTAARSRIRDTRVATADLDILSKRA